MHHTWNPPSEYEDDLLLFIGIENALVFGEPYGSKDIPESPVKYK
jgi:hypothetical protein